jgi:type II secretory pathway pseudopilin PulG
VLDVNSLGRAAPEIKRIDVEANLLSERIEERERLADQIQKKLIALALVLVAGAATLPPLVRLHNRAAVVAAEAQKAQADLQAKLAATQQEQQSALPILEEQKLLQDAEANTRAFLGQVTLFFNQASPQIALGSVRADVTAGELKIQAKADAEQYAAARDFTAQSNRGPGTISAVLVAQRPSDVLHENGVYFELVKRAKVKP